MKIFIMIIGLFLSIQAQALTFNSHSVHKKTITLSSSKISKTANTLHPNPLKSNEFFKTTSKPQNVSAGQPVSSLNAKTVSNACEEKKVVTANVKCSK